VWTVLTSEKVSKVSRRKEISLVNGNVLLYVEIHLFDGFLARYPMVIGGKLTGFRPVNRSDKNSRKLTEKF
jgi:hypothetical protein